jgi:hypothetical protein
MQNELGKIVECVVYILYFTQINVLLQNGCSYVSGFPSTGAVCSLSVHVSLQVYWVWTRS